MKIGIKTQPTEVISYVAEVQKHADLDKNALGFFPTLVYENSAKEGNLFVAVSEEAKGRKPYVGHLLFRCAFPHAHIVQLFVAPTFRRQGIAEQLLKSLVDLTEKHSFLNICARVAADLPANQFYERTGFLISRTRAGGTTRNRTINVRVKHLDTLDLFKLQAEGPQYLGLVDKLANKQAVYVIDLNVFWDVVRRRSRSEYANVVVGAAFSRLINLVITPEFVRELERSSSMITNDPALEFALQLPVLSDPDSSIIQNIIDKIAPLVFPTKRASALSVQDRSDLIHLAIAIHHGANGFVTGEKAILKASNSIYGLYGVEVIHVESLSAALKTIQKPIPAFRAQLSSDTLYVVSLAQSTSTLEAFLEAAAASAEFRQDFLSVSTADASRRRIAISSEKEIVCLASWDANAGIQGRTTVRLIANEEHPAAETALNCVVHQICKETSKAGPTLLLMAVPNGQVEAEKVALQHGFQPTDIHHGQELHLQKLCIGRPVTNKNWERIRATIRQRSGLSFQSIPKLNNADVPIPFVAFDGNERTITLSNLEKMLSPTLFALPDRHGCLAPIRRGYAEQLFEGAPQLSLTPKREASLFSERVYFSAARNSQIFMPGTPILFYESGGGGGRACAIAVARVVKTETHAKSQVPQQYLRHGVIDPEKLENLSSNEQIAVTSFDNVIIFENPIKLERLRELNCIDGSNLVSARRITYQQLVAVLEEGCLLA